MTAAPTAGSCPAPRDVSRETEAALERYAELLRQWNARINLVSRATLDDLWTRHFFDSIQVFDAAAEKSGIWADLGSGGGFPGAVVAILARDEAPELRVTCVESDLRKAVFLRTVSRETSVPFRVIDARIEDVSPLGADIVSARALSPLVTLLDHADRHLKRGGIAIFPKGARHAEEIEAARRQWTFSLEIIPSILDPNSAILKIGDLARV